MRSIRGELGFTDTDVRAVTVQLFRDRETLSYIVFDRMLRSQGLAPPRITDHHIHGGSATHQDAFKVGDLVQLVQACRANNGTRIKAGSVARVVAVEKGGTAFSLCDVQTHCMLRSIGSSLVERHNPVPLRWEEMPMPRARRNLVKRVFGRVDGDGTGELDVGELAKASGARSNAQRFQVGSCHASFFFNKSKNSDHENSWCELA
jgi:hypothetical protein